MIFVIYFLFAMFFRSRIEYALEADVFLSSSQQKSRYPRLDFMSSHYKITLFEASELLH